jgi:hypothetical protein
MSFFYSQLNTIILVESPFHEFVDYFIIIIIIIIIF